MSVQITLSNLDEKDALSLRDDLIFHGVKEENQFSGFSSFTPETSMPEIQFWRVDPKDPLTIYIPRFYYFVQRGHPYTKTPYHWTFYNFTQEPRDCQIEP